MKSQSQRMKLSVVVLAGVVVLFFATISTAASLGQQPKGGNQKIEDREQSSEKIGSFQLNGSLNNKELEGKYDLAVKISLDPKGEDVIYAEDFLDVEVSKGLCTLFIEKEEANLSIGEKYWLNIAIKGEESFETVAQLVIAPDRTIVVEEKEAGPVITGRFNFSGSYPYPDYFMRAENTANGYGAVIISNGGTAVNAKTNGVAGYGVLAENPTGVALYSKGDAEIEGDLNISGLANLTSVNLPDNSVGSWEIVNGSVAQMDLAIGAVGSTQIEDGTIVNADISPGAAIAGSKIAGGAGSGLDADLLDGKNSTDFLAASGDGTLQGNLDVVGTIDTQGYYLNGQPFTVGDITAVYAENGLREDALSGDVHLNVGQGTGITVSADSVAFDQSWGDGRYVNVNESNSINSSMITDGTINQSDVSNGYVDISSGQTVSGFKVFSNQIQFTNTRTDYPSIWIFAANNAGLNSQNNSSGYPAIWAKNDSNYYAFWGQVPSSSVYGIGTNGRGYFAGWVTPTSDPSLGSLIVTSPLTVESEIYLSGSGEIVNGQVEITFDSKIKEIIADTDIKVIVTPTSMCQGLAVVEKSRERFVVQELGNGKGNATFDWLVIARKAISPSDHRAEEMPKSIPIPEKEQIAQVHEEIKTPLAEVPIE